MQVGVVRGLRTAHVLDGKAKTFGLLGVGGGGGFEDVDEGWTVVPVQAIAPIHHHVAVERGQGDEAHICEADLFGEGAVFTHDALEGGAIVVHQIHLVHGDDQVGDSH